MSVSQKKLIKKYFNSLVEKFITNATHRNITIIFKNYIENDGPGEALGQTICEPGSWHWMVEANGAEVPGSRWQEPNNYTVYFLNHYSDQERWRGTVVHEFAHLWLYAAKNGEKHKHDDLFYSKMDYFEDWLDKKWSPPPRQDKGGDWNQHIDPSKRERRDHSPSQFHNNNPSATLNEEEFAEYNRLFGLLNNSKSLTELEQHYQTVKNSPVYLSDKRKTPNWLKTAKEELDDCYNSRKIFYELINLMENSKSLPQLKQIYQAARNNPRHADSKPELDKKYNDLKNNLLSSSHPSIENEPNNLPWKPLLIGSAVIVIIWLILIIFSLLNSTKRKKRFPKNKIY